MKSKGQRYGGLIDERSNATSPSAHSVDDLRDSEQIGNSYRWWVQAPGPDETFRSLVERSDRFHGVPRPAAPSAWLGTSTEEKCDAPNSRELLRLARMLDIPAVELINHRLKDGPHLLYPTERRAYCAQCIREDQAAGRQRAFRREWARFFVLSCAQHRSTLLWAEPRLSALKEQELALPAYPDGSWQQELIHLIDDFSLTLEACLWRGAEWPHGWYGTPHSARAYMARHLCNLMGTSTTLPLIHLWTDDLSFPFVAVPKRPMPALYGPVWESVRRTGRPAWRRAALWLTVWQVIPGLPARWKPVTVPECYLDEVDDWWDKVPPTPHLYELRRTYSALRRSSQTLLIDREKRLAR